MMGRLSRDRDRFFYEFCLDEVVPVDHLVRKIDTVLDLGWVHDELALSFPKIPSGLDSGATFDLLPGIGVLDA